MRRRLTVAASLVIILTTIALAFPARARLFRTPEGAAYDAYMRYLIEHGRADLATQSHKLLTINVPSDSPEDALRDDFRRWSQQLLVLRDTTRYAQAVVSEDSLERLGSVWDLRARAYAREDEEAGTGPVYSVAVESCRGWPCRGGADVAVRRLLWYYRAHTTLGEWVE